jgi:hypothetical protein
MVAASDQLDLVNGFRESTAIFSSAEKLIIRSLNLSILFRSMSVHFLFIKIPSAVELHFTANYT